MRKTCGTARCSKLALNKIHEGSSLTCLILQSWEIIYTCTTAVFLWPMCEAATIWSFKKLRKRQKKKKRRRECGSRAPPFTTKYPQRARQRLFNSTQGTDGSRAIPTASPWKSEPCTTSSVEFAKHDLHRSDHTRVSLARNSSFTLASRSTITLSRPLQKNK